MILTALLIMIYIGIGAYMITGLLSVYEKLIVIKKLKKVTKDIQLQVKNIKDVL